MRKDFGLVCWTGHIVNMIEKTENQRQSYAPVAAGSVSH